MGSNSPLPVTKPVAYLMTAVVFIAALSQTTLVVPAGVVVDAVLYKELYQIPPILLLSEVVVVK